MSTNESLERENENGHTIKLKGTIAFQEEYRKTLFSGISGPNRKDRDLIVKLLDDHISEDEKEIFFHEAYIQRNNPFQSEDIFRKRVMGIIAELKAKEEEIALGRTFCGIPTWELNEQQKKLFDTYKDNQDAMEKFSKIIHNKAKQQFEFQEANRAMTDQDIATDVSEGGAVQAVKELNSVDPGWRVPNDVKSSYDKDGQAILSQKSDFDKMIAVMPGENDEIKLKNFVALTGAFGWYWIATKNVFGSKFMLRCITSDINAGRSKDFKTAFVRAVRDLAA